MGDENDGDSEKKDNTEQDDDNSWWADTIIVEEPESDVFLSVEEAAEVPVGEVTGVCGYIIGSASRSIYNTITAPPFESKTSLILADRILKPDDGNGNYDAFTEDDLFPVRLTGSGSWQRELNLVDHPENWHRFVYIYGVKTTYFGLPGLENIMVAGFAE